MRRIIRTHHYSYRTEKSYLGWARRCIVFHGKQHPSRLGKAAIEAFLSHLAVDGHVAPSTQNQALNGVLFLYRCGLEMDVAWLENVARASPRKRSGYSYSPATARTFRRSNDDDLHARHQPRRLGRPQSDGSLRAGRGIPDSATTSRTAPDRGIPRMRAARLSGLRKRTIGRGLAPTPTLPRKQGREQTDKMGFETSFFTSCPSCLLRALRVQLLTPFSTRCRFP